MKVGIGQDSHRFEKEPSSKPCIIGGITFEGTPGLDADSDGDVIFHAICNAITSITHVPILGRVAIDLCHNEGITNSRIVLEEALATLEGYEISHVALSVEGKRPKFLARAEDLRRSVAEVIDIEIERVGMTFTSGDELTAFGRGEGLQAFCTLTLRAA